MSTSTMPDRQAEALPDGGGKHSPRIVVGVDGSDVSRSALIWALAEAARRGAHVDVVSAFPVDEYWMDAVVLDPPQLEDVRADTDSRARALVEEARQDPAVRAVPGAAGVPVTVVVVAGAPAERLVDQADGADLLVVGSRGRSAVRSTLLGSVALHCAAHAPCSVVVVPGGESAGPTGAGDDVVVGLDDSEMGRAAVSAAVSQASRLGGRVVAVIAHNRPDHWSDLYSGMARSAGETHDHALRRGERIVAEVLGKVPEQERPEVEVVADWGSACPVLVRQGEKAGLLVVGSRSRSELTGMVLGSVALNCVVHASSPVMVVRPTRAAPAPENG